MGKEKIYDGETKKCVPRNAVMWLALLGTWQSLIGHLNRSEQSDVGMSSHAQGKYLFLGYVRRWSSGVLDDGAPPPASIFNGKTDLQLVLEYLRSHITDNLLQDRLESRG